MNVRGVNWERNVLLVGGFFPACLFVCFAIQHNRGRRHISEYIF